MSRPWKITAIIVAATAIISTPAAWLLSNPDAGQLAGATIQTAVGVTTLVWALFQHPDHRVEDSASQTGQADADAGGTAVSGIRRRSGHGSTSVKAEGTGDAIARGDGSSAVSGIDYS